MCVRNKVAGRGVGGALAVDLLVSLPILGALISLILHQY